MDSLCLTLALFLIPEDRKARILLGGVVVCVAVLIVTSRPVVQRLPTIALDRGGRGDGFSLQFRPPAIAGRKRIKVETQRLVTQIHAYLRESTPPWSDSLAGHQQMVMAMSGATSEQDKQAIWNGYTLEETERSARERQDLESRFGGSVRYLLHEFERRRVVNPQAARKIEWMASSRAWLGEAAAELEALGRRI